MQVVTERRAAPEMIREQADLFPPAAAARGASTRAPLAERMRPRSLQEFVGQEHLLAPGRVLRAMIESRTLESLIFWGPPGCGKTTLAHLLAQACGATLVAFSAVLAGVKELRAVVARARAEQRRGAGRPAVILVDEIHRFNKAQQDALLPHVEAGTITLIGATTENPSFEVIPPLLSRTRVLVLHPLSEEELGRVIGRALADRERGLGGAKITPEGERFLIAHAQGDARVALGTLELAARFARAAGRRPALIELAHVEEAAQRRSLRYDRAGEEHYNIISAFIKSMRGGDPDAAVYWLMRMVEAGEDPLFIARRMVIFAAEDVGNADPRALQIAVAAKDAVHFVGLPEGRIPLAQAATYLATCPKSNAAYRAMLAATADVKEHGTLPVPLHLRNAPTELMKSLGYGAGYRYPHDYEGAIVPQQYLPNELVGRRYYEPSEEGEERAIRERLEAWKKRLACGPRRRER